MASKDKINRCNSLAVPDVTNPFVHTIKLSVLDKIQIGIMTVTIFPLRVLSMLICIFLMWVVTSIALFRIKENHGEPMRGWRRSLAIVVRAFIRGVLFSCGYHKISVRKLNSNEKVSLVVAAPHTTYFDAAIIFACEEFPTGVSRIENDALPFLGKIVKFTQPIYVSRKDPNSRQNTIKELKRRAMAGGTWPQMVIFPEGTCSNGKCLICFKPGAFIPGQSVQPVSIRHINRMNTTYWTWDGPGAYKVMWLTLCQFSTTAELSVLPPYHPSEEEKADPKLFASNVRNIIAQHLEIPVSDHSFEDCRLMLYAAKLSLPVAAGLVEFQKLARKLGWKYETLKEQLVKFSKIAQNGKGFLTVDEFAKYLELPVTDQLKELFNLYDRNDSGTIDFREYVIGLSLISQPANTEETVRLAFKLFDKDSKDYITESELGDILIKAFSMDDVDVHSLFSHIDADQDGRISFDEFKTYAKEKPEYARLFLDYQQLMQLETPPSPSSTPTSASILGDGNHNKTKQL